MSDLTGLKFPFAVNGKGGVSLVELKKNENTIIDDKIEQLLNTGRGERAMECDVFAELDTHIFDPTDASTKTLIEYEVKQAILQHIPEINVTSVSVLKSRSHTLNVYVTYTVVAYGTQGSTVVGVGEIA